MKLDYDDPEVQKNVFDIASLLCFEAGLEQAGNFLQSQALKAEISSQDSALDTWMDTLGTDYLNIDSQ